ncbi:COG4223 family protein [Aestuariivirga sp.]|uniref:COG4223 family protein n=1 Tax=Aestuariivirga sp. TaxID=2650926 RepID=UPI003BA8D9B5
MTMDTPEEKGAARPQVIDLEAEEIRSEAGDTPRIEDERTQTLPPPPPPRQGQAARKRNAAAGLIIALILGLLAGGWLYRDLLYGYLPSNQMTALRNQVAALEQNNSALAAELAGLKQNIDATAQAATAAGDAAAQAGQGAQSTASKLDGLASRLDQTDSKVAAAEEKLSAASTDLDSLRKSLSTASSQGGTPASPADSAALAAIGQRIDALEKDVASLKSSAGTSPQAGVTATLSQALSDLKAKVAAGTAYPAEYDRIARMVPAAAGLDVVAAHAADGLPDAKGLAAELRAAIPSLPQPAAPPAEDDSYFGTFMKSLSGIVTVRPIGETDWRQVAEKSAAFAEAGDLNQAISVIDAAEGEKPMALSQWRARAAARLQLEAALNQVSEAVLRQITALGGGASQ